MNIACVGLGKLGVCFAAVLADAGHRVHGVDLNERTVAAVNNGVPPVDETGLGELMASLPAGQLTATTQYAEAIPQATMTMMVVPTPSDPTGRFDPSMVVAAAEQVNAHAEQGHTLVVVSTVMPGTTETLIAAAAPNLAVAYCPSFIALGSVIHDLRHPDVALIGSHSRLTASRVVEVLATFHDSQPLIAYLTPIEAEIAKISLNAMLSAKVAWANTIAIACTEADADPAGVLAAVGSDSRIGGRFLQAGTPARGPCLSRDSTAFAAWLADLGAPADLPLATRAVDRAQVERTVTQLAKYERVAVLGLAYKPGTAVTDASFGVEIAQALTAGGVHVVGHDPAARPHGVALAGSAVDAIAESDAVLIACPWPEYTSLAVGERFFLDPWRVLSR